MGHMFSGQFIGEGLISCICILYTVYVLYFKYQMTYTIRKKTPNPNLGLKFDIRQGTAAKDLTPFCLKSGRWLKKRPIATCAKEPSSPGNERKWLGFITFDRVGFLFFCPGCFFFGRGIWKNLTQNLPFEASPKTQNGCTLEVQPTLGCESPPGLSSTVLGWGNHPEVNRFFLHVLMPQQRRCFVNGNNGNPLKLSRIRINVWQSLDVEWKKSFQNLPQ